MHSGCCSTFQNIWSSQSWMTCTNPINNNIVSTFKIKVTWFVNFILNRVKFPRVTEAPKLGRGERVDSFMSIGGEQRPECIFWDCPLTLRHVFWSGLPAMTCRLRRTFLHRLMSVVVCSFLQECDFCSRIWGFLRFCIFIYTLLYPSDGTLNGSPCQG